MEGFSLRFKNGESLTKAGKNSVRKIVVPDAR